MRNSKWSWIINGDKLILKLAVLFVVLLVISQTLLLKETTRMHMSRVDKLEGEPISLQEPSYANSPPHQNTTWMAGQFKSLRENKVISIRMIKPSGNSQICAIVNGKVMDDFRKGSVRLTVYDGDYVEIDATAHKGVSQFVVNILGSKVAAPMDGLSLEGNANIVPVGKVKFKE